MAEGGRGRPYGAGPRPGTAADSDRDSDRDGGPRPAEVPKGAGRGLDGPDNPEARGGGSGGGGRVGLPAIGQPCPVYNFCWFVISYG